MPVGSRKLFVSLASGLVAWCCSGDFAVPEGHRPRVIMGRDYWPALYKYGDWAYNTNHFEWITFERSVRFDNPEIFRIPAFRDCVPVYYARRPPTDGLATYRHFADTFTDDEPDRELLTSNPRPDRPLLFWAIGKRSFESWGEKPDLDYAEYRTWREAHPNLMYDGITAEWDNDLMLAYDRVRKLPDGPRKANIMRLLGEKPKDRYARVEKMRAYMADRRAASYDGDMYTLVAHIYDLHLAADAGAKYLCLETTNSSGSPRHDHEYRWNVAAMFARGAVRQFGTPWEWYIAGYMNGFMSDGRWLGNIVNVYPGKDDSPDSAERVGWYSGIEWGQSANVLRRAFYFAYLNGPNFTQMEEWSAQFLRWDREAKKTVLSPRGKLYCEFHDFTQAHPDRGVAYTPVAVCVPLAQGYPAWGGYPFSEPSYGYTEGDHAVDAVFFTLVPGFERAKAMARGEEHNLHNTPFAAMYDVIAPDVTSQDPERLLDVMKGYKALVIAGDYPDRSWEKTLAKYESAGGRVIRIGAAEVPPMTKDAESTIGDLMAGRSTHPKVAEIFRGLQKDYFPFSVEGDCLYGANRTEKGWWLWVFNNNGVTKFGDRPEVVDQKAASRIRVSAARTLLGAARDLITGRSADVRGGTFEWTVPAGDLAVFEVPDGGHATPEEWDLVIYGGTPAAISAAVQAKRMGARAVIVSPDRRIGGLTTGGLGQTDIGNKSAFGGIALEFYRAVADWYRDKTHWTRERREAYLPDGQCAGTKGADSMWTFEPSAALDILEGWVKRDGLTVLRGEKLDRTPGGVTKKGNEIISFRTLSGKTFAGRVFIDATYEGDLMAAAGVSYVVGREANAKYGETISGIQRREARYHQFYPGVDPYVVRGDPSSGLLPNVEPFDPSERDGDGDNRVQAYCFRMCLTDDPANRIPFEKPAGYREIDYELLLRNFEKAPPGAFAGDLTWKLPWINSRMPNRKTDTNNRDAFSSDFIGRNWRWPEASYEEREKILKEHLDYQRGLMWTLANHPRVPEPVRKEVSKWGTCKDEFADGLGNGWQRQLYVREARRLVGEYVMTEHECRGDRTVPHPVAMGAYGMDSHHVRRCVGSDGFVVNEGDVEDHSSVSRYSSRWDPERIRKLHPYGIDYGALLPKRAECTNLLVPVCLSASHMAFGSIRMEPVFFALGQAAATAAVLAQQEGCAVQVVDYRKLASRLAADGQVIGLRKRGE